jgi:hypothetical protein
MTGAGASGSAMQLPCPSLDDYDDLDDDNEYAEADQMEEYTEGLGGTDDGDEDPNLAEEISGAAIDDAEQTAADRTSAPPLMTGLAGSHGPGPVNGPRLAVGAQLRLVDHDRGAVDAIHSEMSEGSR